MRYLLLVFIVANSADAQGGRGGRGTGVRPPGAVPSVAEMKDSSAAVVLRWFEQGRGSGPGGWAANILMEMTAVNRHAEAALLAQGLERLAIERGGDGTDDGRRKALDAIFALSAAGAKFQKAPYRNAFPLLQRIYREVPALSGSTLRGMLLLVDPLPGVQFAKQAAMSSAPGARDAFRVLCSVARDTGALMPRERLSSICTIAT